MIAEGLARSGSKEAKLVGEDIAVRWIRTNYKAYKKTGVMHEKYDVQKCGEFGGGGEYVPQVYHFITLIFMILCYYDTIIYTIATKWSCFNLLLLI